MHRVSTGGAVLRSGPTQQKISLQAQQLFSSYPEEIHTSMLINDSDTLLL